MTGSKSSSDDENGHTALRLGAGLAAGFIGKIVEFPLDTVKVLLQTNGGSGGAWACMRGVMSAHGMGGLYRGLSMPLIGSMLEDATVFTTYGWAKSLFESQDSSPTAAASVRARETSASLLVGDTPLLSCALAGGVTGVFVAYVLTPFELIKCRLQVESGCAGEASYTGPLDCIRRTIRSEGFCALWKGNLGTLLREVPGNFAWFGTCEAVCRLYSGSSDDQADLPLSVVGLAGGLAGIAQWTIFYPADTVKSVIQTMAPSQSSASMFSRKNLYWTVTKNIIQAHGIHGLYRGWAVTSLRAFPVHGSVFATFEAVVRWFSESSNSS